MTKELEFLNIISKTLDNSDYLGDDCAYLREYDLVVSHDSLIEGVHFLLDYMTPYEIAKKALLVNISDILASGAEAKYATIALSLPNGADEKFIEEFYKGINEIAISHNISIIGGDLTRSDKVIVSISIIGSARRRNISSRKHACPNYIVAVAGEFGTSAKGLEELKKGEKENYFITIHKKPYIQSEMSERISKIAQLPYAMIDSSDGLADCLHQISKNSKVKIEVDYEKIPKCVKEKDFVLYGGEDYSLVVCLDESDFKVIDGLVQIGTCAQGSGVFIDGEEISHKGYEHFEK